ncbi:MAG: DUF6783 domain-containing protein [Lacrimispora saccharolytica]
MQIAGMNFQTRSRACLKITFCYRSPSRRFGTALRSHP